jgi:hypothetical protein
MSIKFSLSKPLPPSNVRRRLVPYPGWADSATQEREMLFNHMRTLEPKKVCAALKRAIAHLRELTPEPEEKKVEEKAQEEPMANNRLVSVGEVVEYVKRVGPVPSDDLSGKVSPNTLDILNGDVVKSRTSEETREFLMLAMAADNIYLHTDGRVSATMPAIIGVEVGGAYCVVNSKDFEMACKILSLAPEGTTKVWTWDLGSESLLSKHVAGIHDLQYAVMCYRGSYSNKLSYRKEWASFVCESGVSNTKKQALEKFLRMDIGAITHNAVSTKMLREIHERLSRRLR